VVKAIPVQCASGDETGKSLVGSEASTGAHNE
jgi:hypothetical protein